MVKDFDLSEWIVDDKRSDVPLGYIHEGYVREFIKLLKQEIEITVHSDKRTRAQWIYKRLVDNINYKIDKLAGLQLIDDKEVRQNDTTNR